MDHRCLYGHRVPERYRFAVDKRQCPTCGAASVTVEGYHLARRLTEEIPLEAMAAFKTVLLIEESYNVTPREEGAQEDAQAAQFDDAEEVMELSQEVEIAAEADAESVAAAAPEPPERAAEAQPEPEQPAAEARALGDPACVPEPRRAWKAKGTDPAEGSGEPAAGEGAPAGFGDVEDEFFKSEPSES